MSDSGRPLQQGDTIYKINGVLLYREGDLSHALATSEDEMTITVTDGANYFEYNLNKNLFGNTLVAEEQTYTGIGMSVNYVKHKFDFGEVLIRAVPYCCEVGMLVLRTLGGLLTGSVGIENIGGPITTISLTTEVVSTGFANVLMLIVLISVNLAVFNLLPVPALDGCQMVFVLIEWIAHKPINRKVQSWINGIGLIVLIALMLVVDLLKL